MSVCIFLKESVVLARVSQVERQVVSIGIGLDVAFDFSLMTAVGEVSSEGDTATSP